MFSTDSKIPTLIDDVIQEKMAFDGSFSTIHPLKLLKLK